MSEDKTIDLSNWIEKKEQAKQRNVQIAPTVTVDEKRYERLGRAQVMLAALVKASGRVRIPRADIESIGKDSRLDVKVQENGDIVVSYMGPR
jgi:hypothetical protein